MFCESSPANTIMNNTTILYVKLFSTFSEKTHIRIWNKLIEWNVHLYLLLLYSYLFNFSGRWRGDEVILIHK